MNPLSRRGTHLFNVERRPAEPARITICRQSPADAGYREVCVLLDGEHLTMLQFGESYTSEVAPGLIPDPRSLIPDP